MINGIVSDFGAVLSGFLGVSTSMGQMIGVGIIIFSWVLLMVGIMRVMWKYRRALLRGKELNMSAVTRPRIPGVNILTALHLPTPKMKFQVSGFKGLGVAVIAVVVGFAGALTLVIQTTDNTPNWPQPGAAYALGSPMGTSGIPLEPNLETPSERSMTLKINLKDGIRIENLVFDGMDFGKTGLTECFQITRADSTTGFLYGDVLHITGTSSFPTVDMATMEIFELHLGGSVDGHTVEATMSNSVSDQVVESMRGVSSYTGDGTVDRVIIHLLGSATVKNFVIENSSCSVGSLDLAFAKFGKVQFDSTVRVGDGTGINAASFVVNSTVQYKTMVDTLVDVPVTVR
jgi:hypothetical protein